MADYHAILKRAISALPSPSGEARRAVYEKARTALVNQLKSFDPPLSPSEITQQRLQLEDAIRKVESEAAKGLLRPAATAAAATPPAAAAAPKETPPAAAPVAESAAVPPPPPATTVPTPERGGSSSALKQVVEAAGTLGTAPAELGRQARDALAGTETADVPTTVFGREAGEATGRSDEAKRRRRRKREDGEGGRPTRLPLVVGIAAAILVIGVGVMALWTQRDTISAFFGGNRAPIVDPATRTGEKLTPKATDRLSSDETATKNGAAVRAVPTQTISPSPAPQLQAAPATTTPAPSSDPARSDATTTAVPQQAVPLIAQKAILYEEGKAGGGQAQISPGKIVWQTVPDPTDPKPGAVLLKARVEIPDRGMVVLLQMHPNVDTSFPASHLVEIKFVLAADFDGKAVTNVPGLIMKATEQSRGDPLSGASAKVADNFFWIALGAADVDRTRNFRMLKERGWLDLPFIYGNNRRAILTLEKSGAGDSALAEAFTAWGIGG